jgi:hypothetical protein
MPGCPFFEGVQLAGGKHVMGYSVDPPQNGILDNLCTLVSYEICTLSTAPT